jgi:DegV family protein with EDD domain
LAKIAIITDSIASLTKEHTERYQVTTVPVNIVLNSTIYHDSRDLSTTKAYELLENSPDFWKSSAPSPADYLQSFRQVSKYASDILVVTLSSKLSACYTSARIARDIASEELPKTTIEVLDSETVAAAEGFIVLAAARAAAENKTFDEVLDMALEVKKRVQFLGVLETIRHVYRTGRIPKIASQLGAILSLEPVLTGSDGLIHLMTVARTKKSAVEKMFRIMKDQVGNSDPVHIAVMHADTLEEAEKLKERISTEFNCAELFITDFSPVMGYATGRRTIGLAYFKSF